MTRRGDRSAASGPVPVRSRLAGATLPDYQGGSLVNLMASIIRARGGTSPHGELRCLPAAALRQPRRLVYLVLDGLGERQLQRHLAAGLGRGFFARRPREVITSVCPATTAAAVTTFMTGASPAEHGIIGWHLNLPDLGLVSSILPAVTRTGVPLAPTALRLDRYLDLPGYLRSVKGLRHLMSWGQLHRSRFTLACGLWAVRSGYQTLRGLERSILAFARAPGRGLAYAYWPEYDSCCHARGCGSARTRRHFRQLDASLARLERGLAGSGAVVVVTADHGLVDTMAEGRMDLRDVPGLPACLATLPAGDSRQVHCFVRAGRQRDFLAAARAHLRDACRVVTGGELLRAGWFGPGQPHPALAGRCGDFVLLARDGHAFACSLPGRRPHFEAANHGGLSADEMLVPLYLAGDR